MSTTTKIPNGNEMINVQLTVKELMALTGVRFHNNHAIEVSARKKLNKVLIGTHEQDQLDQQDNSPIPYQLLL